MPAEICNNVDDNCNGQIDEGVRNACGACGAVPAEVCNNFDDDCDGQIDEGVRNACGACGAVPAELCNGQDDDCDGAVDDGNNLCNGGRVCQNGQCVVPCPDADGDGHLRQDCGGDDCDDNDRYKYPGASEVLDIRDNDCDGQADNRGLVRYLRYHKPWTPSDWEHRFAQAQPAGFLPDGHYVDLYPTNVCQNASVRPTDGVCTSQNGGAVIALTHGTLQGLMGCTGMLGNYHVSLYLIENGGEHLGQAGVLNCTRIGYVYGGGTAANVAGGTAQFYRHRSPFDANGKGDNMWSTEAREGDPLYNVHEVHWIAKSGQ